MRSVAVSAEVSPPNQPVLRVLDGPGTIESATPPPPGREAAERLFVEHLSCVRRLAAKVARTHQLSADEADEFEGMVCLRLIADDYAVFRRFRWQSTLQTYLTVVIRRLCLDFRVAQWGKWRPSAASREGGAAAVLLERLTMRDGLTFEQACTVLETKHTLDVQRNSLAALHARFRGRRRPRFVSDEALDELPAVDGAPDAPVVDRERAELMEHVLAMLAEAIETLSPRDRLLIRLRFADGLSAASVARMLGLDQKSLYRRYTRLFTRLRQWLEYRDISGAEVVPLLGVDSCVPAGIFAQHRRDDATPQPVVTPKRRQCRRAG